MLSKLSKNYFIVKIYTVFLIIGFNTVAYSQKKSLDTVNLRIDLDNSRGGTTSELFDEVNFIPLETTKESTFGKIYNLEVTEKYFIIFDVETYCVLIFERNGKFHAKIKKRADNEYFGVFTLNRSDNEIILKTEKKALIYNYDGKFLRQETIPDNVGRMYFFGKELVAYNFNRPLEYSDIPSIRYDLAYSKGYNKIFKNIFAYDNKYVKYDYNLPYYLFSPQDDNTCIFVMPYSYNLSHLDSTGIIKNYKLNFPLKYSLPKDFETGSSFTGKRKEFIFGDNTANDSKIKQIAPVFKTNDYLIFHLEKVSGLFTNHDDMMYSLKTNTLYSFSLIAGDKMSSDISVLNSRFLESMLFVKDDYLYTSVPASMLFKVKNNNSSSVYSDSLKKFFEKGSQDDNMIIIESKLKSNL